MQPQNQTSHVPVLLTAVLKYLAPEPGESYLDLTAGYGGHALAVLERTQAPDQMTLVDRDANAIAALEVLKRQGAQLIHEDYLQATRLLNDSARRFDMILADLGASSPHFDRSDRGFSFGLDGPLDMRMDQRQELTAATLVNGSSEAELKRIIASYGEEPQAGRIAHAIVAQRPFASTAQLAATVAAAVPRRFTHKIHPATKTFQALRIAVNDELGQLEASLPLWFHLLAPGGRLAVISFHSLEDRLVKRAFAEAAGERYDAELKPLTKRPVVADQTELVSNPRARSAKLRAVVKNKNFPGSGSKI
jgi:16S rRNA (cytosine1402-N4)-methyltransferase